MDVLALFIVLLAIIGIVIGPIVFFLLKGGSNGFMNRDNATKKTWKSTLGSHIGTANENDTYSASAQKSDEPFAMETLEDTISFDRKEAILLARKVLTDRDNYVILDVETTGMGTVDEVIEIGVIDLEGKTLFHSFIRPAKKQKIAPGAYAKHGISMDRLCNVPVYAVVASSLQIIVSGRCVIAYNAKFDKKLLLQTANRNQVPRLSCRWLCAMQWYSEFVGEWWEWKRDYKWQPLKGGDHTAIGDCQAILRVIREMASQSL